MNKYKLGGINLSSSINPNELGKSVEGIILGLSSLIVLLGSLKGVIILPSDIQAVAVNIGGTVAAIGMAISAIVTTFGLIRKLVVSVSSK